MDKPERRKCHQDTDYCPHAETAADSAVRKVFAIFGVDVDIPKDVETFREDVRFGGKVRRSADRVGIVIVGAAALGIVYALWEGIRAKVGA